MHTYRNALPVRRKTTFDLPDLRGTISILGVVRTQIRFESVQFGKSLHCCPLRRRACARVRPCQIETIIRQSQQAVHLLHKILCRTIPRHISAQKLQRFTLARNRSSILVLFRLDCCQMLFRTCQIVVCHRIVRIQLPELFRERQFAHAGLLRLCQVTGLEKHTSQIGKAHLIVAHGEGILRIEPNIGGSKLFGTAIKIDRLVQAIDVFIHVAKVVGSCNPRLPHFEIVWLRAEEPVVDIKAASKRLLRWLPPSELPLEVAKPAQAPGQASLIIYIVRLLLEDLSRQIRSLSIAAAGRICLAVRGLHIAHVDQRRLQSPPET